MSFSSHTPSPSEHSAIESLALAALEGLGDTHEATARGALYHHATTGDYYALLGVARNADTAAVEAALARLRTVFDDTIPNHTVVQAALDNAQSVLLREDLRARYDAGLA